MTSGPGCRNDSRAFPVDQRHSRIGWSVAGGAVLATFVAIIWTTHSLTRAKADVDHLNQTVQKLSDASDTSAKQADQLRTEAEVWMRYAGAVTRVLRTDPVIA